MPKSKQRILALDPGTKKTGYAVFEGEKLIDFGVKVFADRDSAKKNLAEGRAFVLALIRTHRPHVLAVERSYFSKRHPRTAHLNVYCRQILYTGKRQNLQVKAFAPSTVKKHVTGFGWAHKDLVARMVVRRYPELKAYLVDDRRWKRLHHANMFDAVAVGLTALGTN